MNNDEWWKELKLQEEESSAAQRRALYRMSLAPGFVKKHVKSKDQASKLIDQMLKAQAIVRRQSEKISKIVSEN